MKGRALEVTGQSSAKLGAAQRESRRSSAEAPGASAESCPAHCPRLGGSSRGGWGRGPCALPQAGAPPCRPTPASEPVGWALGGCRPLPALGRLTGQRVGGGGGNRAGYTAG